MGLPGDSYIGKGQRKVRNSHSDLLVQKTQSRFITLASVLVDYLKGVTLFQKKAPCLETNIFSPLPSQFIVWIKLLYTTKIQRPPGGDCLSLAPLCLP